MLERLFGLFGESDETRKPVADDPRVATAALLYHLMDSDGERRDVERNRIRELVAEAYDLGEKELDALLKQAETADREAIDLYAFTSVIKRELDEQGRLEFIRVMWDVVFADGILHELEDNTVWRVADLIGVSNRDRVLLRQEVAAARNIDIQS